MSTQYGGNNLNNTGKLNANNPLLRKSTEKSETADVMSDKIEDIYDEDFVDDSFAKDKKPTKTGGIVINQAAVAQESSGDNYSNGFDEV